LKLKSEILCKGKYIDRYQSKLARGEQHIIDAQEELNNEFKTKLEEYIKSGSNRKESIFKALRDRDNITIDVANKISEKYADLLVNKINKEEYKNKIYQDIINKGKERAIRHTSNRIKRINGSMNNVSLDFIHKASKKIVNICVNNKIGLVVIGLNTGWKQRTKMSTKNNKVFCKMPHTRFIEVLKYKLCQVGIVLETINEAYTSRCSFVDNEDICSHEKYDGERIKRGLFKSKNKIFINSDVNASYNILRSRISCFNYNDKIILNPLKINII
jgi:IS605 OrfB family transposase